MSACEEAVHADDLLLALNGDMGAAARVRERQRERRRQHGHGLQAALHESRSPASAASVVAPPGAAAASTASAAVCARASTRACSTTGAASEAPSDLLQWALRGEAVWVQGDKHSLQAVGEPMGEPGAVQLRAAPGAEELLASMHAIGKRAAYATTNLQPTCPLLAAQPPAAFTMARNALVLFGRGRGRWRSSHPGSSLALARQVRGVALDGARGARARARPAARRRRGASSRSRRDVCKAGSAPRGARCGLAACDWGCMAVCEGVQSVASGGSVAHGGNAIGGGRHAFAILYVCRRNSSPQGHPT